MFNCHQCGTAPFATRREALEDAHEDQQDWSTDTDGCIGWQQADGGRCAAHADQCHNKYELAAVLVTQVSRYDGAQWTEEEGNADGGPGENLRQACVVGRQRFEEQRR